MTTSPACARVSVAVVHSPCGVPGGANAGRPSRGCGLLVVWGATRFFLPRCPVTACGQGSGRPTIWTMNASAPSTQVTTPSANNAAEPIDTPDPITVILDIPSGSVRLIAADRRDTTVEVLPADAAKNRDVKAAEHVQVGYGDGVLRIETEAARHRVIGNSGSVAVTVHLPAGSRVQAKAAVVDFHGVGRLGEVTFEGATGSIDLEEAAGACLVLADGSITVGRLGGAAEMSTQRGDITIAEAVRGTVVLRTESGSVFVGAARGVSAALDAGTGHGRVHNSLQNTAGTAELLIHATTAHGDITARSL